MRLNSFLMQAFIAIKFSSTVSVASHQFWYVVFFLFVSRYFSNSILIPWLLKNVFSFHVFVNCCFLAAIDFQPNFTVTGKDSWNDFYLFNLQLILRPNMNNPGKSFMYTQEEFVLFCHVESSLYVCQVHLVKCYSVLLFSLLILILSKWCIHYRKWGIKVPYYYFVAISFRLLMFTYVGALMLSTYNYLPAKYNDLVSYDYFD